jgi:mannose-6-phosphate isomerase-like protein (cupin superfamily)
MVYKIELIKALQVLQESVKEFTTFFEHGSLSVELYKPDRIDNQQPHERDEVYIIVTGEGKFRLDHQITQVQAGDFLFVPAQIAHHFLIL